MMDKPDNFSIGKEVPIGRGGGQGPISVILDWFQERRKLSHIAHPKLLLRHVGRDKIELHGDILICGSYEWKILRDTVEL